MHVTPTWRTGEAGLHALEAWCTDRLWPLVRVPVERDVGIDAFVQVTDAEGVATGDIFGVQVKAGSSYLRSDGGTVPVERHGDLWREASVPVIAVVHDPDTGALWWGNATQTLRADPAARSVRVDAILPGKDDDAMPLLRSIRLASDFRLGLPRGLGSVDPDEQREAVWQAFALGFMAPHALVVLRRILPHLAVEAATEAVVALSHCTPHPDIFWTKGNLLPTETRSAVAATFRWTPAEVVRMLGTIDENGIDRGSIGQCVYMLIYEDPGCIEVLAQVAVDSVGKDPELAGWAAYLAVARSEHQGREWGDLLTRAPLLGRTFVGDYVDDALAGDGFVSL
jgi:hypothetical protein